VCLLLLPVRRFANLCVFTTTTSQTIRYLPDIICLQEVQGNHFLDFFVPQLAEHGFDGVFKRKSRDSHRGDVDVVDGCAIFFKTSRYTMVEKYEIDFNHLAKMSIRDSSILKRMLKGNVALLLLLEENTGLGPKNRIPKQLIVANTHIYWDPKFKDVKLWQTMTLLKQLHTYAISHRIRKIPIILTGDFNSEVDSAVYQLLSTRKLNPSHPLINKHTPTMKLMSEMNNQPLEHHLPLKSAYSHFSEPEFTNYTGHYTGTLDYIWFTEHLLRVVGVMEMETEEKLQKYTALPSPQHPSDHLPLLSEFAFK